MLEDDKVSWNLLVAETGVSLVAVRRFSVELAVQVIQRRLRYVHAPAQRSTTTVLQGDPTKSSAVAERLDTMLHVTEYFAKSLKITQDHSKWHLQLATGQSLWPGAHQHPWPGAHQQRLQTIAEDETISSLPLSTHSAVEMLRDSALYKCIIDIDIVMFAMYSD